MDSSVEGLCLITPHKACKPKNLGDGPKMGKLSSELKSQSVRAEISLSGFWSKSCLENRGFFGFFGGIFFFFFLLVFPMKMARKNPRKNPPLKPNIKIHQKFQGRVLDLRAPSEIATKSPALRARI